MRVGLVYCSAATAALQFIKWVEEDDQLTMGGRIHNRKMFRVLFVCFSSVPSEDDLLFFSLYISYRVCTGGDD